MNFQSVSYLLFLAGSAAVCCAAARRSLRWGRSVLLLTCLVFALWGGWQGLAVLLAEAVVCAAAVRYLAGDGPARKAVFFLGTAGLLGVLAGFKALGFLTGGHLTPSWVPLGLSFFTFQQLWLLKEVYTRAYLPDPEDVLLLYALFFPTLTAGPILRPQALFPQLRTSRFLHPDGRDAAAGLYAISLGMAKKILLADQLGILVGNGWADISALSAPAALTVILAYTLQLYLDFSGYCDIASGSARLLGLHLPVNFDSPYRALSVGEFWKRWHITLTGFLRECLYLPLGGNRRGAARTYVNILLVFLVSGLWHGAGWTFLVWGALHGLAQVTERLWGSGRERLPKAVRWGITFLFVNVAWVFFRAPSLSGALALLSRVFTGGGAAPEAALFTGLFDTELTALRALLPALGTLEAPLSALVLIAAGLAVSLRRRGTVQRMDDFSPTRWRLILCALLLVWSVLSFSATGTFLYANF